MTLQYQLTVASPLEPYLSVPLTLRLQRRLSVHKKDVVGYADAVLAVMSVDGSRQ